MHAEEVRNDTEKKRKNEDVGANGRRWRPRVLRSFISNFHARPDCIISGASARECEHVMHARVARYRSCLPCDNRETAESSSRARVPLRNAKARKCGSLCPATLHVITAYGMYAGIRVGARLLRTCIHTPRRSADAQSVWNDNK